MHSSDQCILQINARQIEHHLRQWQNITSDQCILQMVAGSAAVHANQSLELQWINDEKRITRQGGP